MKLTFEDLGANWHTAYASYGITFSGGTLAQSFGNTFVSGPTTMYFDPALSERQITFLGDASGPDNFLRTWIGNRPFEPVLFESGSWNPYTATGRNADWFFGQTFSGRVGTEGLVTRIDFTTTVLDDILFDPALVPVAAIPEPPTLALVLVATFILSAIRQGFSRSSK